MCAFHMSLSSPLRHSFFCLAFASLLLDGVQSLLQENEGKEKWKENDVVRGVENGVSREGNGSICNQ